MFLKSINYIKICCCFYRNTEVFVIRSRLWYKFVCTSWPRMAGDGCQVCLCYLVKLHGSVARLWTPQVVVAGPITGLCYLDTPLSLLHQETPHSFLICPLVSVVKCAHHVGLFIIQVIVPCCFARQGLLTVTVQSDDGVVEHIPSCILFNIIRTNFKLEQRLRWIHAFDNLRTGTVAFFPVFLVCKVVCSRKWTGCVGTVQL